MSEPLSTFVSRYLQDRPGLEAALDHPVLLHNSSDARRTAGHMQTMSVMDVPPSGGELLVVPVRKEKENAFQRGVTVGRTGNNDLVIIGDGSISRFHAWFQRDAATGDWTLVDAGSKNGTHLNGERLPVKKPVVLPPEANLKFGSIEVRFLTPPAFLKFLEQVAIDGA